MNARTLLVLPFAVTLLAVAEEPKPTPTPVPRPLTAGTPSAAAPKKKPAGSLADTVRRARASATPAPKKKSLGTITNETLKKPEGSGKGTLQVGPAHPIAELPPGTGATSAATTEENSWRARAAQARERVESADAEVKRLETETKRLENDFYAWSDGNYRDRVIKPAWDQAKEDLRKARAELDAAQNGQADLEEEARKSGVPAGWLREPTPR